jgi:hypothetical protein
MNASEINKVMVPYSKYKGTFPFDRVPKLKHFEYAIINSNPAKELFGHWVGNNLTITTLLLYKSILVRFFILLVK